MPDPIPAPLCLYRDVVREEWIDYNGHMNVAYYVLAFDRSVDHFLDSLDIGPRYAARGGGSCFVVESHVCYVRELTEGAPIATTCQLLDWDTRRIHYFLEMRHGELGYLAATSEQLTVHVNLATRRADALPPEAQARLRQLAHTHAALPRPARAGRVMGIPRR